MLCQPLRQLLLSLVGLRLRLLYQATLSGQLILQYFLTFLPCLLLHSQAPLQFGQLGLQSFLRLANLQSLLSMGITMPGPMGQHPDCDRPWWV